MTIHWSDISKCVGWEKRDITYPTMEKLQELYNTMLRGNKESFVEMLTLYRFLKSPEDEEEKMVMQFVVSLTEHGRYLIEHEIVNFD